jgi:primosomal protein N' (replication factor Y)
MTAPLFATPEPAVAKVALPLPVDRLFDYALSPEQASETRSGCRVLVPFRGRKLAGVVVEIVSDSEFAGRLRRVERVLDAEPVLSQDMLAILSESAREVLCPIGIALQTAIPAGSAPRMTRGFALTPRGRAAVELAAARGRAAQILERLAEGPAAARELHAGGAAAETEAALARLAEDGLITPSEIERGPTARVRHIRTATLAPDLDLHAARARLVRAPRQIALLERIAAQGETPTSELFEGFSPTLLRALVDRGFVRVQEREAPSDLPTLLEEADRRVTLTADQEAALKPILERVRARQAETFLLHGVTGSGKTEVYLRAVAEALAKGRQALVLVPEITLTHQIVARLRARFGDALAVLHSGLKPSQRIEQWERLRRGNTPIAVGARSALFAPLEELGVIVIDEEHDGAYKNDEGFRYHARTLAAKRAARAGCPLILGSATPSLETRYAADQQELRRLVLAHRIGERPLPVVQIVDLAKERERSPRGRKLILSPPLRRALTETLAVGGQTVLFLNRRGFSTQVFCFDCGFAERCPHCDVALVYHAAASQLRCHYCEHATPPPDACGGCGAPDTALLGIGTERLEEEVRSLYPHARIARLDRDTAARRGTTESVLRDLREERLDILIGTQMVAKGHDFPGVRLVGVVAADVGLHMPDFRAAERTFQLLTQVAGRAGRDTAPGRVIVQSFVPDHYAVAPVQTHDYERFYAQEIGLRASLGFPPFGRIATAIVSAEDESQAQKAAGQLARALGPARTPGVECLGPAPAPLSRLRGRYRFLLLLKGEPTPVWEAARTLQQATEGLPEAVTASVDVDPIHML